QCRTHDEQGEDDQVVEHPVADRLAIGVEGDGKNAAHERTTSTGAVCGCASSFWRKKSSRLWRTGFTDSMRALLLRSASSAASSFSRDSTAWVISPELLSFAPSRSNSALPELPCQRTSTSCSDC